MLLEQAVDQIIVLFQRNQLKRRLAIHSYDHGLVMT